MKIIPVPLLKKEDVHLSTLCALTGDPLTRNACSFVTENDILPYPGIESAFDSSWEIMMPALLASR